MSLKTITVIVICLQIVYRCDVEYLPILINLVHDLFSSVSRTNQVWYDWITTAVTLDFGFSVESYWTVQSLSAMYLSKFWPRAYSSLIHVDYKLYRYPHLNQADVQSK